MKWRKVRLDYAKVPFPLRLFSIEMKKSNEILTLMIDLKENINS